MRGPYDVIVIGAGITGSSTAYHLKHPGVAHIALFERCAPAAGGNGKSAAIRGNWENGMLG
jgi:glycine/D-amino acid oxidase-like deaminating enzyme